MIDVVQFPDKTARAWATVVEHCGGALRDVGHSEPAIEYALGRFRPSWDAIRAQQHPVSYSADLKPIVEVLHAQREQVVASLFGLAMLGFAELYEATHP